MTNMNRNLALAVAEGWGGYTPADAFGDAWDRIMGGFKERILKMATVFSYGGKAITTNRLKAGGTEPLNAGWGTGTGTSAATDTALFSPASEARVAGTSTQQTTAANVPNDTYQVVATITAAGSRAITEFGLFDTATAAPQTTLNGAIASTGATSITVTSGTGLSNNGYIQVDSEVMQITAGGGTTTLTVTRGARGSTAATHSSGAAVVGGEALAGGNMFMKGDFSVINLNTGDSIQFTAKLQYT
jgi:hypothetical protein